MRHRTESDNSAVVEIDDRREVNELLGLAHAEATADLSAVARGCRSAGILVRGEAIRARNGLPPNPVRTGGPAAGRKSQLVAARHR
jgi:hypothetical protein